MYGNVRTQSNTTFLDGLFFVNFHYVGASLFLDGLFFVNFHYVAASL